MKLRLSISSDSIKEFLFTHVEKIVLAIVVMICMFFVWKGYNREKSDIAPEDMANAIKQAQNNIDNTAWDDVADERIQVLDFDKQANGVLKKIRLASYEIGAIRKLTRTPQVKRTDPELFPLVELEVDAGFAALPIKIPQNERSGDLDSFPDRLGRPQSQNENDDETKIRDLTAKERIKFEGEKPRGMGYAHARMDGTRNSVKIVGHPFVAIRGLVPIRKQVEEYKRCFRQADEYRPGRDSMPNYFYYVVQRREVAADESHGDWEKILTKKAAVFITRWAGQQPEIADQKYLYTGQGGIGSTHRKGEAGVPKNPYPGLVWPLPPFLLCNGQKFFLHSKVPMGSFDRIGRIGDRTEQEFTEEHVTEGPYDGSVRWQPRPNEMYGELDGGKSGTFHATRGLDQPLEVDHHLFRFFDFKVEIGKAYQYQVMLYVEDPNNTKELQNNPTRRALDMTVIARIHDEKKKEKKDAEKTDRKPRRIFYRKTKWSTASRSVHVGGGREVFVGTPTKIRQAQIEYKSPEAQVMAVVWDGKKGYEMTGKHKVGRGTVVDFDAKSVIAVDPAQAELVKYEKEYSFSTKHIVADIRGGVDLPGGKSSLMEPAEILFVDEHGNLSVRNEIDDHPLYSRYLFDNTDVPQGSRFLGGEVGDNILFDEDMGGRRPPRRPKSDRSRRVRGNRG